MDNNDKYEPMFKVFDAFMERVKRSHLNLTTIAEPLEFLMNQYMFANVKAGVDVDETVITNLLKYFIMLHSDTTVRKPLEESYIQNGGVKRTGYLYDTDEDIRAKSEGFYYFSLNFVSLYLAEKKSSFSCNPGQWRNLFDTSIRNSIWKINITIPDETESEKKYLADINLNIEEVDEYIEYKIKKINSSEIPHFVLVMLESPQELQSLPEGFEILTFDNIISDLINNSNSDTFKETFNLLNKYLTDINFFD